MGHMRFCVLGAFSTLRWGATGKTGNTRPQSTVVDSLTCSLDLVDPSNEMDDFMFLDFQIIHEQIKSRLNGTSLIIFNKLTEDQMSQQEIAHELDLTEGAISQQMNKNIRPVVKDVLEEFGYDSKKDLF